MAKRSTKCHKQLKKDVFNDPIGRAEYEAFKLQLDSTETTTAQQTDPTTKIQKLPPIK